MSKNLNEQAVLLYLPGEDFDRMIAASDILEQAIESARTGEFDGNEIGGNQTTLFMYGPDAELLFQSIEPVLYREELFVGGKVLIRWGEPGSPEREIVIGIPNVRQ